MKRCWHGGVIVPGIDRIIATPIAVGVLVAVGALSATAIAITMAGDSLQPPQSSNPYPSIDIEMPKTTYQIGERLNFTINTYGICASPDVTIYRHEEPGESLKLYEYRGGPVSCPYEEEPDKPHMRWQADNLIQRFSDEYFGGDGNSVIATSAAITLKKAGNYTISASTIDHSDSAARDFVVNDGIIGATAERMNLSSLRVHTPLHELIGDVVPYMEFKKGEQVLFNATFFNPSAYQKLDDFVLSLGIRDDSENPLPDDISIVSGDAAQGGNISIEHSWMPEKACGYRIMIFSLVESDLRSTRVMSPVEVIPIRVIE